MERSFEGKVALVTGAGKGIGESIAKLLSKEGATVGCNDLTETCLKTAREINESGGKAMPLQFDITVDSQVNAAVDSMIEKFEKVDMLINNAGGSAGRAFVHEMNEAAWDRTIDVNLKGCFLCSKAVLPSMIQRKYGKIVSIASIRAETGLDRDSAYAAAKAGIYGFSRSLAREVAQYTINVNVISPGIIRTGESGVLPWEEYMKIVPLGIGKPADIAHAVLFLCSDESRYITGQVLHVNGGWWPTCK
jgi:3-oxoacyl-[acyl-carrier protein] reductase